MKTEQRQILVIEDDTSMIRLLQKWLKSAGRGMIEANDGQSGLRRAKTESPDAILLDLMLPDIGGIEVAKRLYEDEETRDIPILFITAVMGVENDKGDERIEIDDRRYRAFAKPLHREKLLSELRKAINRRLNNNPDV